MARGAAEALSRALTFCARAYDDFVFHSVAVGDRLVQVCASTAQGASRSTWKELEDALATIRFRWVRLAAPDVGPHPERSRA